MAGNGFLSAPPVFTGENYQIWAVKMESYLEACDLWDLVEADPEDPPLAHMRNNRDERKRRYKAKTCIHSAVSETIFTKIMTCETAKQAWDLLKQEYQGNVRTKQMQVLNLRREFEMQKMKETETVNDYKDKLMIIANKIRMLGEEFSDRRIVEKILVTLPERFESKISSLEESRDMSTITLGELVNALQAQEQRRAYRNEEMVEGAFQVKEADQAQGGSKEKKQWSKKIYKKGENSINEGNKGKHSPCPHCKKTSHPQKKCWFRPDIQCRACKQMGHMERVCKNKQQEGHQAQAAEQQQDEQLFVVSCFSSNSSSDDWLIDSGCTNHMSFDESLFKEVNKSEVSRVKVGNGQYIEVKGKGTVAIKSSAGIKLIYDVLLVPKIDRNLLSVGQLLEKGYSVVFKNNMCVITDPNGVVLFSVKMNSKSFSLSWNKDESSAYQCTLNHAELWHKRMGHFHYSALDYMQKNDLVHGMTFNGGGASVCEVCQLGKQARLPFPVNKAWRAVEKLQLIHTDVCGPMRTASLNGNRYFMVLIDDFSRMCWVYFLKQKSEVASVFWKFKTWIENQSGCKIKVIRSDNGTEYTANKFAKFCEAAGIEHQLTATYTPQQNGVSERKNRTIMEMARCLLFEKEMPKMFWAEAVNTAVFLQNRLPTKALKGKTPFEAWFGFKPSIHNLRIFGCMCFTHVPDAKREKLDQKAEYGVFVGYSTLTKGYRVYQPLTGRIIVSRDVKFDEAGGWNWATAEPKQVFTEEKIPELQDDIIDDEPIRGTRPLTEIYQKCNMAVLEPAGYDEAAKDPKWLEAMEDEIKMIHKNQTWELVDRPLHKKTIGVKWVYRTKLHADGSVNKFKARLVVKGYAQLFGVDFSETFAPVARLDTIRLLLALAAQKQWKIYQLDVKSAFLNGYLDEEIFVEQPEGFVADPKKVYLLKKALYGLKQAPRAWYSRIDDHLLNIGFNKSMSESTLYIQVINHELIVVSLYVDDLLVTGSNEELVKQFKVQMMQAFEMTDLGEMTFFLGLEIQKSQQGVFIGQQKYAKEVLNKFNMEDCKSVCTPLAQNEKFSKDDGAEKIDEALYRSIIGCLMYLTATRPDIMFAVSLLSRYMHCASELHYKAAKRVLRYIKGTLDHGIKFEKEDKLILHGFADSDWAGSCDDMRSTSGYLFSLGSGCFCWSSKKQEIVAQSTAEAEYIAAAAAVNQALWLRKLMTDLKMIQNYATEIFVDNQAAIAISNNPVFHGKTKHFKIKYYFVREVQKNDEVRLVYCKTEDQLADILTKGLSKSRFELLKKRIGVCSKNSKEE
ncbi:hypothetical protein AB3S75_017429 [Citrus x aurantiifolia]